MQAPEQDKKLARYLLGELSEIERIDIEDRYSSDVDFFDELLVAEDELIDDYVRRKLTPKDGELFEQNFLCSAARRERVKSARALAKFADTHAAATRVTFGLGFGEIERDRGSSSTQAAKVTVPRGTEVIKLQLDLFKDEYKNYLVVLEDAQQHDIWRGLLQ